MAHGRVGKAGDQEKLGIRNAELFLFRIFIAKQFSAHFLYGLSYNKTPMILSFSDKIMGVHLLHDGLRCGTDKAILP